MLSFYIVILVIAPWLILEVLFRLLYEGHSSLVHWSFTRRADGNFSRWQIAGQVAAGFPLVALCAIGLVLAVRDFASRL